MKFIITLTFFFTLINCANAQGNRDSIYSEVLKEKRIIEVILPAKYKPDSNEKFDVLYLLDGYDNIQLFHQIQQLTVREKYAPQIIIVAVFNTDRNRDFTPSLVKYFKTSGGAANFLSFLKKELMPYIDKTYPTNGQNILYGHSLGGLFAMYALLNEPQLFSSYVAVDPSFWYDNGYANKLAGEKLSSLSGLEKTIFITGREGALQNMGIDIMDSILKSKAPKDLSYKVVAYEDESHGSVRLKSMYDGLKMVYKGFSVKDNPIEYHPINGIVLKDKPFVIYNVSNLPGLRYTADGTAPTMESTKMERETTFSGPVKLNIKSFTPKGKYDKTVTVNFILGEAPTPIAKSVRYQPGGLSYSYFEGKWDKIPNFKKLKPTQSGIADKDFTFHKLPSKTNFACVFEGLIEIKEEGYYILGIESDDGAKLYLKNKLIIDYDGIRERMQAQSFLMPLQKGFYPIRIEYFQQEGWADLQFKYMLPGGKALIDIPHELLYSAK